MDTPISPEPCTEAKSTKKKVLLQWRPKDGKANTRDAFYSPARDLAHIGPEIVKRAMQSLDAPLEPWLAAFLDEQGITIDKIVDEQAPLKMARVVNQIVQTQDLGEALKTSGFEDLPAAIQLLFYARIGQVALAATWSAVKDVSLPDSAPPAGLEEIMLAAEDALPANLRQACSDA